MKRLNWLKNLGLSSTAALAVVPVVLTSTSCGINSCTIGELTYANVIADQSAVSRKTSTLSFDSLLSGNKGYHNGNYILFVGSNTGSNSADPNNLDEFINFFRGSSNDREMTSWFKTENFYTSYFFRALVKVGTLEGAQEGIKDLGFYFLIDNFDNKFTDKKGHELFFARKADQENTLVDPTEKWTEGTIQATKTYNKDQKGYDWDSDSVSNTDYIRQDASAIAYRAFMKRGLELYPKNDKRKEADTFNADKLAPKMVVFKDGVLVGIKNMPAASEAGRDEFAKLIVDNYKIAKDEKKQ